MQEGSPFRAYGNPKKKKFFSWFDFSILILLVFLFFWLYEKAQNLPVYQWNWELLGQFLIVKTAHGTYTPGLLLRGLFATLRIGIWTIIFSVLAGTILGILLARPANWLKFPLLALINVLRNTPPLVILFCVYFFAGNLLPITPLEDALRTTSPFFQEMVALCFAPPGRLDGMFAAVIGLGAYQSAYVAEIVRGSLMAVPKEQWDAARALGFSRWQTISWVILPQAVGLLIPPMTGQCISTFKESALASLISLPELTFQSLEIMAVSNMTFETWVVAGVMYLIIGLVCSEIGKLLEWRYSKFNVYKSDRKL